MNLTKKRKKKGFTLIELMAVIAIIAILAAVLVPTVNGYIQRSKKTAIITQARNVVNAVETYNATATKPIVVKATGSTTIGYSETVNPTIKDIQSLVGKDMLDDDSINKLDPTVTKYYIIEEINNDSEAIKNVNIDNSGALKSLNVTTTENGKDTTTELLKTADK